MISKGSLYFFKIRKLDFLLLLFLVRWDWVHLVLRPLLVLWYQPQMTDDGDCGAIGGMRICRGNRRTRRKPTPVPLCPPQIPHDQTWARTRAAAEIRLKKVTSTVVHVGRVTQAGFSQSTSLSSAIFSFHRIVYHQESSEATERGLSVLLK
jgi:hypothetical protein